jgi:hypothetical protein
LSPVNVTEISGFMDRNIGAKVHGCKGAWVLGAWVLGAWVLGAWVLGASGIRRPSPLPRRRR